MTLINICILGLVVNCIADVLAAILLVYLTVKCKNHIKRYNTATELKNNTPIWRLILLFFIPFFSLLTLYIKCKLALKCSLDYKCYVTNLIKFNTRLSESVTKAN